MKMQHLIIVAFAGLWTLSVHAQKRLENSELERTELPQWQSIADMKKVIEKNKRCVFAGTEVSLIENGIKKSQSPLVICVHDGTIYPGTMREHTGCIFEKYVPWVDAYAVIFKVIDGKKCSRSVIQAALDDESSRVHQLKAANAAPFECAERDEWAILTDTFNVSSSLNFRKCGETRKAPEAPKPTLGMMACKELELTEPDPAKRKDLCAKAKADGQKRWAIMEKYVSKKLGKDWQAADLRKNVDIQTKLRSAGITPSDLEAFISYRRDQEMRLQLQKELEQEAQQPVTQAPEGRQSIRIGH